MGKNCFFMGHRDADERIWRDLERAVETHIIEYGVTEFVVGMYGRFDRMAAETVIRAKKRHEGIRLQLLTPYHPARRGMVKPTGFDGILYPPGMEHVPPRFAIVRANRYMVNHADCLIAYAWHAGSNARTYTYYAKKRAQKGLMRVTMLTTGSV